MEKKFLGKQAQSEIYLEGEDQVPTSDFEKLEKYLADESSDIEEVSQHIASLKKELDSLQKLQEEHPGQAALNAKEQALQKRISELEILVAQAQARVDDAEVELQDLSDKEDEQLH